MWRKEARTMLACLTTRCPLTVWKIDTAEILWQNEYIYQLPLKAGLLASFNIIFIVLKVSVSESVFQKKDVH